MEKSTLYKGIAGFFALIVLILDSKTALSAAAGGIRLCIQTVIPSLFPFFVLSCMITNSFSGMPLPLLRPLGRLLNLPEGTESLLVSSFLGGYPAGAQAVANYYRNGQLTKMQAERLLPYCNNPGPSFLFGMVAFLLPDKQEIWLLWGAIILSALLTARLFPADLSPRSCPYDGAPACVNAMTSSVTAMGCVCGWIIVFRVFIAYLRRWFLWMLPDAAQMLLIGFAELSNGCYELTRLSDPDLRFFICGCILSWGGLCVTMQTASVVGALSMKPYCLGKAMQTACTLILCISIRYRLWLIPLGVIAMVCIPWKFKNCSRFPGKAIV